MTEVSNPYDGNYVLQIGTGEKCGRKECTSEPRRRVKLGRFVLEIWVCNKHVLWAIELDKTGETQGKTLGWHYGYPRNGMLYLKSGVQVIDLIGQTKASKYGRDVSDELGTAWKPPR